MPFRSDADRDAWDEMQRDAAPDVRVLSEKVKIARTGHELDCGCFIAKGERYKATAMTEDGKFAIVKTHAYWQECRLNGDEKHAARFLEEMRQRDADIAAGYDEMRRQEMARRCPDCDGAGPPDCERCGGTGEQSQTAQAPKQEASE